MKENRKRKRRIEDIIGGVVTEKEFRNIKVSVISGIILLFIGTVGTQIGLAWKVQQNLVQENAKLNSRLDLIAETRQKDALRSQGNMHDMATVIDVVRDMLWCHTYPKMKNKPYTSLADRIPDIPADQKSVINHHIGDVPLVFERSK
jgi:hypothetical protein